MRRLFVAIIATFLVLTAKVIADDDIINFPDPYFKKVLVNMKYAGYPEVDLNHDGEIQYSEAVAYDNWLRLDCEYSDSIADMTGIKEFINLKKLLLERNSFINEIDLSAMVNLEEINLNNNWNLEVLNASGCTNLGSINCNDSKIKYLNAENCKKVNRISCLENPIENINLKGCINLQSFSNTNGNLIKLDFKDCLRMDGIWCSFNKLSELDLSHLQYLTGITCNNNQLKKIDLSNSTHFLRLKAFNNHLESVNIRNSNNKAITTFQTNNNPDLKCIEVDDAVYSKEHWKEIDEWTEFSEDCSNSINDNQSDKFMVFPNPANHTIIIERTDIESVDLRILDITGRIYISYIIPYGEIQIRLDVSRLSVGAYVIEINNLTQSLIIE